jgi:hypothetical protein
MNFLKNLLIIAILGSVVYGTYISLKRNNGESAPPPGVADAWPTAPKVELSQTGGTAPQFGGPLPLTSPTAASSSNTAQSTSPTVLPAAPFSSSPPPTTPPAFAASSAQGAAPTTVLPASPTASLGTPTPAEPLSPIVPATPDAQAPMQPPAMDSTRIAAPPSVAAKAVVDPTPAAGFNDQVLQNKFTDFMSAVQKKLDEGKLADAHLALSILYGSTELPAEQSKQITSLLDQLAGTVIYSRKHYLEPAYFAQPGDTLEKVAQKYNIPWQLLGRINGLISPNNPSTDATAKDQPLPAGMELKVVRGPFEAVVRLDRHELTLMLQNRYAGRFPIAVGRDQPKLDGEYTVRDKTPNPTYYGPDGVNINPNDPKNPLGAAWIGLTDRIGIHGAGDPQSIGRDDARGAIGVGNRDLQDLYGILSVGSRVRILR